MKEWFTISSWCIITDRYTMTTSLFSLIITQCWQIGSLLLRLWWDSLAITRLWALSHLWRCWSLFRRLCRCHHLTRSQDHHSTSDHWMNISPVEQKRSSALITLITEHIAGEQKRTYSWTGVCVWSGAWQIKSCGQLPDKLTITTVTLTRGPGAQFEEASRINPNINTEQWAEITIIHRDIINCLLWSLSTRWVLNNNGNHSNDFM